jgi:hypothetical protein
VQASVLVESIVQGIADGTIAYALKNRAKDNLQVEGNTDKR